MTQNPPCLRGQVAFITGAAQRIGAEIARQLHAAGMDVLIHYRRSASAAQALQEELQSRRADSARLLQADLHDTQRFAELRQQIADWRGRLDLLVNNASSFYPTPLQHCDERQWDDLLGSNLKAPFFLACQTADLLRASSGAIANLVDIHAERPLKAHPIYSIAKAGNAMMVKTLARELGPSVRVNGVAPGAILWPEAELSADAKREIVQRTALKRAGTPGDIARAVLFLYRDAPYISGQILAVDGGRTTQQ